MHTETLEAVAKSIKVRDLILEQGMPHFWLKELTNLITFLMT